MTVASATARCPICGGTQFRESHHRPLAQCARCGSFERTRLVWLVLQRVLGSDRPLDVAHFAPERGIARALHARCGGRYRAFDIEPAGFPLGFTRVEKMDLSNPIDGIAEGSLDLVLHNHVLEHVPCNAWRVLQRLDALLKPGGAHVFTLPIGSACYREDLDPAMSAEERVQRFGQADHMRMFGRRDTRDLLAAEFGRDVHFSRTADIGADELDAAGIPRSVLDAVDSHTVFVHLRESPAYA